MATPANLDNTVFVGDLDRSINETNLFEMFTKFGQIGSVRVCRDPMSHTSLGYGYVNFIPIPGKDPVNKAVEALSYTKLLSTPIRVMPAQSNKQIIKNGVGNVYVKGLPKDVDSRTLHDTFEVFGVILSAKVVCSEEGKSLGYGYVQYRDVASAQQAVERAHGMLLSGSQLVVAHHVKKSARGSASAGFTNVYTKNLPKHVVTDSDLIDLYKEYGEITSACLLKAPEGKQGHGFVNFKDQDTAKNAVEKMNGRMFDEVAIFAAPAQKKLARQKILHERYQSIQKDIWSSTKDRNLYVKNLDPCYDNEAFKLLFTSFGTITSSKVMYDSEGKSRGFGFVCFDQALDAQRAIKELHGQTVAGRRLYVALAQPKGIRKAHLEQAMYHHNFYPRMGIMEASSNGNYMSGASNLLMPTPVQTSLPSQIPDATLGNPPPMIPGVHMPPGPIPFPFLPLPHMMPTLMGSMPGPMGPAGQMHGPMGPLPNPMATMHSPLGPIPNPMDLAPNSMSHAISPMGPGHHPMGLFPRPMGPLPMNLPNGHGMPGYPRSNNFPHMAPLAPSQTVERQNTGQKSEKGFIGKGGRQGKGFGRGRPYWGGRGNRNSNNNSQRGANAHNTRQQPLHIPVTGPQVTQVTEVPANLRALCNATPPEQRKTMLGECLYAKIRMHSSEKAAKITGMLLELEDDEVLGLLENGNHLKERVDDAIKALAQITN